jgi:peptide/nickel transport system substrate-binding protein
VPAGKRFYTAWVLALLAVTALCLTLGVAKARADSSASPASGVSPASAASPSPDNGKTVLRVGWNQDIDSLNPFVGAALPAYTVYNLNYDFLVRYDAATLKPIPGLATSWSHSADGKTWTFKLRQGVKWQDGEPFTSADVVFTYNYVIKNELSAYAGYTQGITKVTALDDFTVEFSCEKPKATMLQMWVPIVPKHIWSKVSPKDGTAGFENLVPVIGTGAFQTVEWKHGSFVRMKANPNYWGGKPKVDEVLFEVYTNGDTMASDLKAGLIQYASVTPAAFSALKNDPGKTAALATSPAYDEIGFNCYTGPSRGNPALRDPAFRSALAWAIDTKTIAAIAYNGAGIPATSILPSNYYPKDLDYHWQPTAEETHGYDPAKANSLLDAAGYRDTNGDGIRDYKGKPIKLRLWAENEKPELGMDGKLITGYLRKVGLQVTLTSLDPGAMNDGIYATKNGKPYPDYDMFVWDWAGDFDPGFLLSVLTTAQIGGWSDSSWSNAEYDRLYNEQDMTLDPAKRLDLVHQMQAIIYQQCPYIPLVYTQSREVYDSEHWTGWTQMPAGTGSVDDRWTYLNVHPKTAAVASTGASRGVLIAVVVVVVVLALGGFWLLRRRSAKLEVD